MKWACFGVWPPKKIIVARNYCVGKKQQGCENNPKAIAKFNLAFIKVYRNKSIYKMISYYRLKYHCKISKF